LITSTAQVGGELGANAISYVIPLAEGDGLTLSAQGPSNPRLRFTTFEGGAPGQTIIAEAPQAGGAAIYSFTSTALQWVRVDVEPTQPGAFSLAVALPRATGTVADIGAAGVTLGETCNGLPARFAVGDTIVVSPEGDDLLILQDYANPQTALATALRGDTFEVIDPPVCHTSAMGEDAWFWYVYSFNDDTQGCIQEGVVGEYWVCVCARQPGVQPCDGLCRRIGWFCRGRYGRRQPDRRQPANRALSRRGGSGNCAGRVERSA
jgi:hypothetical protein